jgi:hypothetical protein
MVESGIVVEDIIHSIDLSSLSGVIVFFSFRLHGTLILLLQLSVLFSFPLFCSSHVLDYRVLLVKEDTSVVRRVAVVPSFKRNVNMKWAVLPP